MLTKISKKVMTRAFKKTMYEFQETPQANFNQDMGIYVHVPFCYTKCSFCPFYKEFFDEELKELYVDALIKEIQRTAIKGNSKWIYFGGGTPNTLTIQDFERITATLKDKVTITNMGIELLPSLVTKEYLEGLQSLGFSKISVGIEAFNEETIKKTGRRGSTFTHISEMISHAQTLGLHVAVDLMIGLPEQTTQTFSEDIKKIIQIKPNQITIYPYMIIRNVKAIPSLTTKEQFIHIENAAIALEKAGYNRKSVWIFILPETTEKDIYDSSKDELVNDYCGFGPASFSTYDDWKVVKPELLVWLRDIENGVSNSFVARKTKNTDDWRNFANKIYDLKTDSTYQFPFYIRMYDFILKLARYYSNGHLSDKGRYFSHEITKAVVEALPFPIQNPKCITNFEEYQNYKAEKKP
ncbi:MAG: radical SAM protein [Asgard group archaeon]|nr:radical SAM protein [Asgard group archaeon]